MLVTWKYRPRDTIIQRLDPRSRLIFLACVIAAVTVPGIWDIRLILPLFLLTLTLYLLARIEWRDVRRVWFFVFFLVFFIVGINSIFFGRGGPIAILEDTSAALFVLHFYLPGTDLGFSRDITLLRVVFSFTQVIRMLAMAIIAIPIPYTMDPSVYGIAFRKLGFSDKIAFTIDLALRFLPTLARDLSITIDAQRARGYEMENLKGGVFDRLRRLAPLVVPVTMQSTVNGEEVIDAMDLRAFGTAPRTWLKAPELRYTWRDYALIGLGLFILILFCVLRWGFGFGGDIWIPPFLTEMVA